MLAEFESGQRRSGVADWLWLSLLVIMLPTAALYGLDMDRVLGESMALNVSKVFYSAFVIILLYSMRPGFSVLRNKKTLLIYASAALSILFIVSLFIGFVKYFYVPMWLGLFIFCYLNDNKQRQARAP